jgi:hypothetical protein
MKKYELLAVHPVIPVIIQYREEGSEVAGSAVAYVNYGQDRVWFPHNPELETDEMARSILATLDPPIIEIEAVPPEILEQIERVKAGREFEGYGHITY